MDSDRTPPAQLAAGGATVPAGAGYAPSHQDDHDTDGGHDPAGKFVSAVNSYLASMKFKRDLGNVQPTGLADNMPPPPPNIVTDWYAKSEEERKANPGREKKSSGDAPPLHPVMIALIMQEARKKAEAAGKTAAGVLGADVVIEGRPDLDERKPAVEKKADWWDKAKVIGRAALTTPLPIAPFPVAGSIGAANYIRNNGSRIVENGFDSAAGWEPGTTHEIRGVVRDVPEYVKFYKENKDSIDKLKQFMPVLQKRIGKGGDLDITPEEFGGYLDDIGNVRKWWDNNKDTVNTVKNVFGWLGKDGLGLGGKNWHYILGGIGALGLGYAGYKMMGSDNAPSNAHAAQQRGAAPRDPHSSEYEDMMLDMMMRRRQQY